jgi:hypothetical protein
MRTGSISDEPNFAMNPATSGLSLMTRRETTAVLDQGRSTSQSTLGADISTSKTAKSGGERVAMLDRERGSTSGNVNGNETNGVDSLGEDLSYTRELRNTSRDAPARGVTIPAPVSSSKEKLMGEVTHVMEFFGVVDEGECADVARTL